MFETFDHTAPKIWCLVRALIADEERSVRLQGCCGLGGKWRGLCDFVVGWSREQDDFVAQSFQAFDQVASEAFGFQAVEVVASQVFVLQVVFQQMVDDDQDRMSHRQQCPFLAAPSSEAAVLSRQVAVFGVTGGPGGFGQGST